MDTIEYRQLFDPIYASLYNQYDIDINIIHLISDYSKGIIISCSNEVDPCRTEICYDSKFDLDIDLHKSALANPRFKAYKQYQYAPKYAFDAGTLTINGQYRRVFCDSCYQTRLRSCEICEFGEVQNEALKVKTHLCHHHNYTVCGYCRTAFDADFPHEWIILNCDKCGKDHCYRCLCHICGGVVKVICLNVRCERQFCAQCHGYKTLKMCNRCCQIV